MKSCLRILGVLAVIMISWVTLAHAGIWYLPFPDDISADGWRIDRVIKYTDLVMTIAFSLVVAAMIFFIFRYRSRPGHTAVYDRGDKPINIIVTIILGMTVFLSIDAVIEKMSFDDLKQVFWNFPTGKDVVRVEVMPQQFAWNVRYTGPDGQFATDDDIVSPLNQMHVPIDTPIVVQLSSYDVIHSFFVPNLRIKQDSVPGTVTTFWFKPVKEGKFEIACSALCGIGHTNMRGFLTVESKEQFQKWLESLQAEAAGSEDDAWADEDSGTNGIPSNWGWAWQSKQ